MTKTFSLSFFVADACPENSASVAPQQGAYGTKYMPGYMAVLLLIVSVCTIFIVGELGALVAYTSLIASPGMYFELKKFHFFAAPWLTLTTEILCTSSYSFYSHHYHKPIGIQQQFVCCLRWRDHIRIKQ
jgi:hypothetical protein